MCLTADWLQLPSLFLNFSAEDPLNEYKTCQNELVVLGSVWTYGHPAFSKDGGKTFISGAAEGKKKSLLSIFLRTKAVYLLRTINSWEPNAASGVNSCSVAQTAQDCFFTHHIS